MHRRQFLKSAARLMLGSSAVPAPAIAQARAKVRVGYLHVVAVDGHLWTGVDRRSFDRQGIDFQFFEFNTGPEVFDALANGVVDVMCAGGVISNYLALGTGRAFLANDIEIATAQLWVRPDKGVSSFADLTGKQIATTTKTTAHIFLDTALRANGVDPSRVELVNRSMPTAVDLFLSGEVPAVALWVPFNVRVRDKLPEAIKLVDASAYYPQSAVVGGWVTGDDYYSENKEILSRIIRGWIDANDFMVRNGAAAVDALQRNHYPKTPISDITESFRAEKLFTSREWKRLYSDGTVVKWLQQVTDFFMTDAKVTNYVLASKYFDPSLYLSAVS
jgi:NitT/TauT family transport system substrate-binding protein